MLVYSAVTTEEYSMSKSQKSKLKSMTQKRERRAKRGEAIAEAAVGAMADATGFCPEEITGESREASVSEARQIAMKVMRDQGMSFRQIGMLMNRQHTTAIYGVERIETRIEEGDKELKGVVRLANSVTKSEVRQWIG